MKLVNMILMTTNTHRSIFWVRFGHDDVEVEAILTQLRVRVPSLRPLEPRPHRVLDLDKIVLFKRWRVLENFNLRGLRLIG